MPKITDRVQERPHRGLTVSLVCGIMLAMGPLFGSIVSVFVMVNRTALARELVVLRLSDGTVPFPVLPVLLGFAVFPVGLVIVWVSTMRLSAYVSRQRRSTNHAGS